jgi:hypothetical protein
VTLDHLLAQVAANEGAFESPRELDLVWQTVEGQGATTEARLAWLSRHSARVAGGRACRGSNCRWSRHVRADGTLPAEVAAGVGMEPGWWEAAREERMRALLARARFLVAGGKYDPPCKGTPVTWGGDMDTGHAERQGLVALECEGTINTGYALGGRP